MAAPELNRFLAEFDRLQAFYNSMHGVYNSSRPYDPNTNNPAFQLIRAITSTSHGLSEYNALAVNEEFDTKYGKNNPILHEFARAVESRFATLERAVRDNMGWKDVHQLGGCSSALEYLFRVPSEREVPFILALSREPIVIR